MFNPFESAVTITPKANAPVENIPIATSPFIFLLWLTYIIMNDAKMTTGVATYIGEIPTATAKETDANPTSARPWPINEYFFKTKIVPSKDAQIEINIPIIKARFINGYEKIFIISVNSIFATTACYPFPFFFRSPKYYVSVKL